MSEKMINKYLQLVLVFFIAFATSQSQWIKVRNMPASFQDIYYLDIYFLEDDPQFGWACGYEGTVVRTTDGGNSWEGVNIQDVYQLESVHFPSRYIGYTSGDDKIYKSTDGGISWFDVTDPRANSLWGNFFISDDIGVVIGGGCNGEQQFFRTSNGGITWNLFTDNEFNTGLTDVFLYDPNGLGYASSSGRIWITNNGGRSWELYSITGSEDWQEELTVMGNTFLVPFSRGCSAGGPGGMRYSHDNGRSWEEYSTGVAMFGAFLQDSLRGWACGWERGIYYTSDGGDSWELVNCGIEAGDDLDDIWFINDTLGFVVGDGIYRTGRLDTLNPHIVVDGPTTFCEGESTVLYTTTSFRIYKWSNGETSRYIEVTQPGKYWVEVANVPPCDNSVSDTIEIIVNPKPVPEIELSSDNRICEGDSIILRIKGDYVTAAWQGFPGEDTLIVKNSGTYTAEVLDTNGCTGQASVNIQVVPEPQPEISVVGQIDFCVGDSVELTATPGYIDYIWYKDAVFYREGTNRVHALESAEYMVEVVNTDSCSGLSASVSIEVRQDSNRLTFSFAPGNTFIFDSTKLLSLNCTNMQITNRSDKQDTIFNIRLMRNIEFSLPQSQFPIYLEPYETVEVELCYEPSALAEQYDSLFVEDICSEHKFLLKGTGAANTYLESSRCKVPIVLKSKGLAGKPYFITYAPYPNPAVQTVKMPYSITLPLEESDFSDYTCSLYNSFGTKMLTPEQNDLSSYTDSDTRTISSEFIFDLHSLPQGLYFIVLTVQGNNMTFPLVLQK